jgi:hypothetical protein
MNICGQIIHQIRKHGIEIKSEVLQSETTLETELKRIFPDFTHENAKAFNCRAKKYAYWWPYKDIDNRVAFLNWMIKRLENDL